MVIIDGKKFACPTCIKGHRTSSCQHTDRPLTEVLKKGRPPTQCEHCRELRKTNRVHGRCDCVSKPKKRPEPERITLPPRAFQLAGAALSRSTSFTSSTGTPSRASPAAEASTSTATPACECQSHSSDPSEPKACRCCGPSYALALGERDDGGSGRKKRRKTVTESRVGDGAGIGMSMDSLVQAALSAAAVELPKSQGSCCSGGVTEVEAQPTKQGGCCGSNRPDPIPSFAPPASSFTSTPTSSGPSTPALTLFAPSTAGTASCFCGPSCPCAGCVMHDPHGLKFRRPSLPASAPSNLLRRIREKEAQGPEATPCPTMSGPATGGCLGGFDLPTIEEMLREGISHSPKNSAADDHALGQHGSGCSCCGNDCSCSTCACSGGGGDHTSSSHHPRDIPVSAPSHLDVGGVTGMMGAKCAVPSCGISI